MLEEIDVELALIECAVRGLVVGEGLNIQIDALFGSLLLENGPGLLAGIRGADANGIIRAATGGKAGCGERDSKYTGGKTLEVHRGVSLFNGIC